MQTGISSLHVYYDPDTTDPEGDLELLVGGTAATFLTYDFSKLPGGNHAGILVEANDRPLHHLPWANVSAEVRAPLGDVPAPVLFAGMAPGFLGLTQWNLIVLAVAGGHQTLQVTIWRVRRPGYVRRGRTLR